MLPKMKLKHANLMFLCQVLIGGVRRKQYSQYSFHTFHFPLFELSLTSRCALKKQQFNNASLSYITDSSRAGGELELAYFGTRGRCFTYWLTLSSWTFV